jgi:hypothetical protein
MVPRQLPGGTRFFAGREAELKALDELLNQPGDSGGAGAVVVTAVGGMAGVGKTALAVHWAQKVADLFPDGQLYVNLRGYDPESMPVQATAVTGWFLAALGVPGAAIPAEAQARAGLYRCVRRRHEPGCIAVFLPTGGCWSCWTMRGTPPRCGRCWRAGRGA